MAKPTPVTLLSRTRRWWVGPRLILRQLWSQRAVNIALIVIVFLTSLSLLVTPRLFNEMSDDAIRQSVGSAEVALRNVSVGRNSRILAAGTGDPFTTLETRGTNFQDRDLPESLQGIIADQTYVVDSPPFVVVPFNREPTPFTTFLRMRHQQDVDQHVRLVAGTLPAPREPVRVEMGEDDEVAILPLFELAVTAETLSELRAELGDRLFVTPDAKDPLYHGTPVSLLSYLIVIEISGIIEPTEPEGAYWNLDFRLHQPRVVFDIDFNPLFVFATGLISPTDYGSLLKETRGALWAYTWRYSIDPDLVDADGAADLAADLRSLEATFPPIGLASLEETGFTTGLSQLLDDFLDQRDATVAVLSLAAIGLLLVALTVVALLAALSADGRRYATRLLRSRGASIRQLTVSRITEGVVLSVPAALFAYYLANLLVPAG